MTSMRTSTRPLARLTVLALITLGVAGCGSGAAGSDDTGGGSGAQQAKAERFATCMREHGVRDFPDPDASGELTIDGVVNGSGLDPDGPAWKRAAAACKDLQPAGFTGRKRSAEQQDDVLQFARCMREHGVKDFPDPAVGDPPVDTNRIPSSNAPGGMAILNAAMRTCGSVLKLAAGGQR